jgi:ABC-type glycerol-3-phosphate transport system substrate-binding protein
MWGSMEKDVVDEVIKSSIPSEAIKVVYWEIPESSLDKELIEALAARRGPDMVLLPLSLLTRYKSKLLVTPFAAYNERLYRDNFIQEGDLFLTAKGVLAFPLLLDPLVMYFNRDLLDEINVPQAPKFWDEFISLAKDLSARDKYGNISRSAVALGEYRNINYAREILAALFIQSGNPIVSKGTFANTVTLNKAGASAVLDFYTEFANPQKPVYSWNRSLGSARSMFLSSDLGIYLGFGSEYKWLRRENPNLDFDIAPFPRPRNANVAITYGKLTGVAILNTTGKSGAALQVALTLSSAKTLAFLQAKTGLPPVHRALLAKKPTDAFGAVMYDSVLRARGFLDPNPALSAGIFRDMIEGVTSGRARSKEAIQKAHTALQEAMR